MGGGGWPLAGVLLALHSATPVAGGPLRVSYLPYTLPRRWQVAPSGRLPRQPSRRHNNVSGRND